MAQRTATAKSFPLRFASSGVSRACVRALCGNITCSVVWCVCVCVCVCVGRTSGWDGMGWDDGLELGAWVIFGVEGLAG